ncbi:HlyC/CorC family transporter [Romboutsia maritimum]|uniref:HlyC/CorC family transporter n=1 Tax=Romboutsia maritimum TaxID=2020948 RepID=A0A371IUQ0_9FIRM|nr:hemolysin family protein [Romboutsia maritimum]RDY24207.1 HlyC/CorC family transporter [Romboutsia maritimum]
MNLEPEPERLVLQLILIVLLTSINAFFASSEIAIVSVNKTKIKSLSKENNSRAKILEKLIEEPSKFLATIQVGITLAGFFSSASAATSISSIISSKLSVPHAQTISIVIVTLILSYITLVFGELVPKRIALQNKEEIALKSSKIIYFVSIITRPFTKILSMSTNVVLRIMGYDEVKNEEELSEEEIRDLIAYSQKQGSIQKEEKDMIEGVFELNDKLCKEIMTSRKDTYLIDIDDNIKSYIDELLSLPYSRIPVYEDNIDNIIGILHIKDLLKQAKQLGFENLNIREILKNPFFVPKTIKANELFKIMQSKKIQMALLVDEYGGFSGIVTLEDLIEEVMGDIEDEYDMEEDEVIKINDSRYKVKGSISVDEFNEIFDVKLDEGDYDTLNGYIINTLGEIPKENELKEIQVDTLKIKIDKINDRRIEDVIVTHQYKVEENII